MPSRYNDLMPALGYTEYPYTDRGITYYDNPLQTEYHRQTLSDFQRNKMLDDSIDYLMQNPVQQNYVKYQDWKDPGMDYGQKIYDSETGRYRNNPQAMANIHRMHGEGDDLWLEDWNKLYGAERRAPAMTPLMASAAGYDEGEYKGLAVPSVAYGNWQPNWDYINSLENFKEYGGDINMMSTADAYEDIDKWVKDPKTGDYMQNPEANVGGVGVGEDPTGTGGFYSPYHKSITLNPANVVKKYPTAPMGTDSEWEFFGPDEVNVDTPYFDPLRIWNLGRVLPHETGHMQEDADKIWGWDEPNPGAYLEGTYWGNYADHPRHPRMHMMDRSQWDWRDTNDKSLSKTQFANLQAAQKRGLESSLNRGYFHEEDFDRSMAGFGGSGRSRIEDRGRPMYQSEASRAVGLLDRTQGPGRHHFNTGGLASLMV